MLYLCSSRGRIKLIFERPVFLPSPDRIDRAFSIYENKSRKKKIKKTNRNSIVEIFNLNGYSLGDRILLLFLTGDKMKIKNGADIKVTRVEQFIFFDENAETYVLGKRGKHGVWFVKKSEVTKIVEVTNGK